MRAIATMLATMFAAHEHERDMKQRARDAAKIRAAKIRQQQENSR